MIGNRLSDYLDYIKRAAKDALSFVKGLSKDEFLADKRTQQAVIMSLVIIGEAATKIMDQHAGFANGHPQIPWRGMRSRIAHGYFEIDLNIAWETVQTALPEVLKNLPPGSS